VIVSSDERVEQFVKHVFVASCLNLQ